jgi:hypothetical protein
METLVNAADKVLGLLPFNGDKTVIGLALKYVLPVACAKFPFLLVVAPIVDHVADALVSLGLAHKGIKALNK